MRKKDYVNRNYKENGKKLNSSQDQDGIEMYNDFLNFLPWNKIRWEPQYVLY